MPSPFLTGLSGLRVHARAVEVVANNLANLNTVGFKGSRSDFRDLFYQQIGQSRSGVAAQVGIGAAPITVSRRFEQGAIQSTGGLLDAAVQGEGFFIVEDDNLTLYTRAGNFQLNQDQELVTVNGELVQGWVRDRAAGTVNTNLPRTSITLQGNDRIEPTATTSISVNANLQTGSTQPFARPIEVFDSLGAPHILTLTFTPATPLARIPPHLRSRRRCLPTRSSTSRPTSSLSRIRTSSLAASSSSSTRTACFRPRQPLPRST